MIKQRQKEAGKHNLLVPPAKVELDTSNGPFLIKDEKWSHEWDIQTNHSMIDFHRGDWWSEYFERDTGFGGFMEEAYASDKKYSIRVNPITGKKEMMIAGTDSVGNWVQNVVEGLKGTAVEEVSLLHRYEGSGYYDEVAKQNGVEVIYGHSRGAAHLTDMETEAVYVGIDGATAIGSKRPDMVNVIGDQMFDKVIGFGHKDTVKLKKRGFHNVTKSKTRIRSEGKAKGKKVAGKVYKHSHVKFHGSKSTYRKKVAAKLKRRGRGKKKALPSERRRRAERQSRSRSKRVWKSRYK